MQSKTGRGGGTIGEAPGVSAIVLAAGASSRMGRPKPLVRLADRPILDHVLSSVRSSRVAQVIVVLGSEADRVRREIDLSATTVVVNDAYARGMSSSIQAGLRAADGGSEAFLIVLGDQPLVAASTHNALIDAWSGSSAKILIPTFRGARGNPVLVDRSLASAMDTITGDRGCRAIFPDHEDEIREVPVEDPGILVDLDTEDQIAHVEAALDQGESLESIAADVAPMRVHARGPSAPPREHHAIRSSVDVLAMAQDLRSRNETFAIATVVRAVRPTSGKPGNKAIVLPTKELLGWVGGSCAESAVLAESLAAMRDGRTRLLRLARETGRAPASEGVVEYVMECHSGGTMDIYIEPHLPKAQLLIVGESPVAHALASLGHLLDYRIVVVAPGADRAAFPEADEFVSDVESLSSIVNHATYVVVATMGKYDETALRGIVPTAAPYVGLVASRKRAAVILGELRMAGVPREAVGRVRSPAGIDLSAETAEEIAVSILAEITKVRRAAPAPLPVVEPAAPPTEPAAAIDPVCGMEVDRSTPLRAVHVDTTYYFCSESCQRRFLESPEAFLG